MAPCVNNRRVRHGEAMNTRPYHLANFLLYGINSVLWFWNAEQPAMAVTCLAACILSGWLLTRPQ